MQQRVPRILVLMSLLLSACGAPSASVSSPKPTASATASSAPRELNFYNWDTYIDPSIVADFEKQFNAKVNLTLFTSNEELLKLMEDDDFNGDLIVPSDYTIVSLRRDGKLAPLDKDRLPNLKNVDPLFVNQEYDPGNRYCAPYQWGTMGIGYDREATGRDIESWQDFFDPAFAGRVSLLDDGRNSLGVALLAQGYSPNTTSKVELDKAVHFLNERATQIAAYAPDTGQELLVSDTVDLALEWSGDIFQIMAEHPNIRYVIPREGSIMWNDGICIPTGAANKELAEDFINFLLEPKVGARLSNFIRYSSPNKAALPYINPDDRNNPSLYPSAEVRSRLFSLSDLGEDGNALYKETWEAVMNYYKQH